MLDKLIGCKQTLLTLLCSSEPFTEYLLGPGFQDKGYPAAEELKKYIHPFLFAEDAPFEQQVNIFIETAIGKTNRTTADMDITVQIVSPRALLTREADGQTYTVPDRGAQLLWAVLADSETNAYLFGIGPLSFHSAELLNAKGFYGRELKFTVPHFR